MRSRIMAMLAVAAALALTAAAFFLPGQLSQWDDRQLLDDPHIIQEEAREGFAESVQLTVAEKLLLIQNGTLNILYVGGDVPSAQVLLTVGGENSITITPETEFFTGYGLDAAEAEYTEALSERWAKRIEATWSELRTLQAMGAMPTLWGTDSQVECLGWEEMLYIDSRTQISFQAYYLALDCTPYSLQVTVDAQSGRILSFSIHWKTEGPEELNWGLRGAANFGSAWRDYWGLDSVGSDWYGEYNQGILERIYQKLLTDGEYSANGDIAFTYDGQTLRVPLRSSASKRGAFSLYWNP